MSAYMNRDRIRDLYDVAFITTRYWQNLSDVVKDQYRDGFAEKGIEQFDITLATQADDLIDKNHLAEMFLQALDIAAVRYTSEEIESSQKQPMQQRNLLENDLAKAQAQIKPDSEIYQPSRTALDERGF